MKKIGFLAAMIVLMMAGSAIASESSDHVSLAVAYEQDIVTDQKDFMIVDGAVSGDVGDVVTVGTQDYWKHTSIPVQDGDTYTLSMSTHANGNHKGYWYLTDENGVILDKDMTVTTEKTVLDLTVTIPANASVLYVASSNEEISIIRADGVALQSQIEDDAGFNHAVSLPDYYFADGYLDNKVMDIIGNAKADGITFAWITDMHFSANRKNSLELLKYIREHSQLSTIICGGDYPVAFGDEDELRSSYFEMIRYAKALYPDWFSVRGNHDFGIKSSKEESTGITWDDDITVNGIIRTMAEWRYEVPEPKMDIRDDAYHIYENYNWVLTNENQKVKIIGFTDHPGTDTSTYWGTRSTILDSYVNYLAQILDECNGYTTIIITHCPMASGLESSLTSKLIEPVKAFANRQSVTIGGTVHDYRNTTGDLAFCLSGHCHKDQSVVEDGILHITTTCDALYQDDNYGRTGKTINEQAFDIFNVDLKNRSIRITRIGAGEDREFTY